MRLTKKLAEENKYLKYIYKDPSDETDFAILNKLGQLEDIEDELGIEITELYKKFKEANETMKKNETSTQKIWFRLFGKTWALTKEELK